MELTFVQHCNVAPNLRDFREARGIWGPRQLKDIRGHFIFETVCLQLGVDLELLNVLYDHLSQSGVDFRARLNILWPVLLSQPATPSSYA